MENKPIKWEYKISNMYTGNAYSFTSIELRFTSIELDLNKLGKEGWELCSTSGDKDYSVLIFKRPKV